MPYQSKKIADMRDRGDVEVLTLSETGEWFASKYGKYAAERSGRIVRLEAKRAQVGMV